MTALDGPTAEDSHGAMLAGIHTLISAGYSEEIAARVHETAKGACNYWGIPYRNAMFVLVKAFCDRPGHPNYPPGWQAL